MPPKPRATGRTHNEKTRLAEQLAEAYRPGDEDGPSIRELAEQFDLSYGVVHRYLTKIAGVTLRSQGGKPRTGPIDLPPGTGS